MKIATYKVYSSKWVAAICLDVGERFSFSNDPSIFEITDIQKRPNGAGQLRVDRILYYQIDSPELGTGILWPTNIVRPIKTMVRRTQ